jgi:hypothetical protein
VVVAELAAVLVVLVVVVAELAVTGVPGSSAVAMLVADRGGDAGRRGRGAVVAD